MPRAAQGRFEAGRHVRYSRVASALAGLALIGSSPVFIPAGWAAERGGVTGAREAMAAPFHPVESPFVPVVRAILPAVVYIDATRKISRGNDENRPPSTPNDLFHRLFPGEPGGESKDEINLPSSGSGFIIDPEGHILTNNHLVGDAQDITVHLNDGRMYTGDIVGRDDKTDVAVLRIHRDAGEPEFPVVRLGDSDSVEVGEWAIAIGNPLGELEGSVTVGVVSAKGRSDLTIAGGAPDYQDFIQTDASINFGNSGGPLVNTHAEVIGINTAINAAGQGLGFAIPINMARNVAEQLIATGAVVRGYLGIVPQQLTPELAEGLGLPIRRGILVANVEKGGPAETAGFRQKDVIVAFNGRPVTEVNRFRRFVAETKVDSNVIFTVQRLSRELEISVRLTRRPDEATGPESETAARPEAHALDWMGAKLQTMTRELAQDLELSYVPGVVVSSVDPGSAADEAGIAEGDVITEAGDRPVRELEDWTAALRAHESSSHPLVLLVSRDGVATYLAIRLGRP